MGKRVQTIAGIVMFGLALLLLIAGAPAKTVGAQDNPPSQAAPALVTQGEAATDWARIQQSGKLVVGTASGYPPFEYYNDGFALDGFDPALMQEIAKQLGVTLELKDYTFDGLASALRLGEIDAVAAALSKTPQRATVIDFSMPYYASSDAVLAATSYPGDSFSTDQNLANTKVGVQNGTLYAGWAQTNLVKAGILPAANLFVFGRSEDLIQALKAGQVDVAILDALPAQEYIRAGGVKEIAKNLTEQEYAIGVRKGSSLLPQFNLALTALQQNGILDALYQEYLAVDEGQQPTPTPTPVPVPVGCLDDMKFIADVTYDDTNLVPVVNPGQQFVKTWRVMNTGTCAWTNQYSLAFVSGNVPAAQMGGQPVFVKGMVPPGGTYDFSATLVAPQYPGQYQAFWQLNNAQKLPFGQKVWVRIQVPGGFIPTPAPTATAMPSINFTVDRNSIKAGDCVTFRWDVTNVNSVYFYSQGQDYRKHGVAGQSSQKVCPQDTNTYYLRVEKKDGTAPTPAITVYVQTNPNAPYIQYFTADPAQIFTDGCTTLRWSVVGDTSDVTIKLNGNTWWTGAPLSGSRQQCGFQPGDAVFELEARGPGGKSKAAATVSVLFHPVPAPTDTPSSTTTPQPIATPTPYNPAPVPAVIDYFTADKQEIGLNECTNVDWSVSGGVTNVEIRINDSSWVPNAGFSGSQEFCAGYGAPDTIKFTIYAQGMSGTPPQSQDVYVRLKSEPEPTATPTEEPIPTYVPQPPVIEGFSVDPNDIMLGDCVNVAWSVGGTVDNVELFRDEQSLGGVGADGSTGDCPPSPGTTNYRLHASNSAGLTDDRNAGVNVNVPMPTYEPEPTDEPMPTDEPGPLPNPDDNGGSDGSN